MQKYFFILLKIFTTKNKPLLHSLVNFLSFLVLTLSLSFIIIILSVNDGFQQTVLDKIITMDGLGRYNKHDNSLISNSDILSLHNDLNIELNSTNVVTYEALVKSNSSNEGIIINQIDSNGFDVFNLDKFLINGNLDSTGLLLGINLFDKLQLNLNDSIQLIIFSDKGLNIDDIKVSGVYQSHIPFFDNHVIYTKNKLVNLSNKNNVISEIVINKEKNIYDINNTDYVVEGYIFNSFIDRHYNFINWLNTYDAPIKMLLIFIFLVSLMTVVSNVFINLKLELNSITVFYILGMNYKQIKYLYLIRNLFFSFVTSISAIIFSYVTLLLQSKMHIIKVPSDIYMIDYIPVSLSLDNFLIVVPFMFITFIISSMISFNLNVFNEDSNYIKILK